MSEKNSKNILYCSFCGKSQHEVRKLIAGPTVFICDECVTLCEQIIAEESGVANVVDPLAGSWFIEDLTNRMEAAAEAPLNGITALSVLATPQGLRIWVSTEGAPYLSEFSVSLATMGASLIATAMLFHLEDG